MEIRIDAKWTLDNLPPRSRQANKGTYGTLGILAGSSPYRGAAVLASKGALRAGAGLVRLASIEKVCAAAAAQLPCLMLHPLEEAPEGGVAASALETVLGVKSTVLLAGCGMGNTAGTAALIEGLLRRAERPLVLDADALNILAGHLNTGNDQPLRERCHAALDNAGFPVIITPHIGEMARLSGLGIQSVAAAQTSVAVDYAVRHNCVVVLKSHVTVVAAPDKTAYINDDAGNPGMAKGGSGDVLAGIIASLMAQGLQPQIAAAAGVWLHAAAGDKAAAKSGEAGLSPAELPDALCSIWKDLGR